MTVRVFPATSAQRQRLLEKSTVKLRGRGHVNMVREQCREESRKNDAGRSSLMWRNMANLQEAPFRAGRSRRNGARPGAAIRAAAAAKNAK